MTRFLRLYGLFFAMLYPVIFFLRIHGIESVTRYLIPSYVFILFVVTSIINRKKHILLSIVFFLIFCGDTIINLMEDIRPSVIPFTLTHLLLFFYFLKNKEMQYRDIFPMLLVFTVSTTLFLTLKRDILDFKMLLAFAGYLFILSMMVWRGLCFIYSNKTMYYKTCIIVGSMMFFFTDIFVSLFTIYHQKSFLIIIWILYPPALFLLSIINVEPNTRTK